MPENTPDPLAHVRDGYDRWARVYDHDANPLIALEEPAVREAAGDVRGHAVLDLGCGTGRHAVRLAAAGATVTAVDFSRGMLAESRGKPGSERVRFLVCDLRRPLPFTDGAFQFVLSGLVLEHIPDLGHFFGEARRVLRPGGRAVISTLHPAMFQLGAQARFTDPDSGERILPGSVPHQVDDFVAAARGAGFVVESVAESAADAAFAVRFPRAERYVGWPMLVVMQLRVADQEILDKKNDLSYVSRIPSVADAGCNSTIDLLADGARPRGRPHAARRTEAQDPQTPPHALADQSANRHPRAR